MLTRPELEDSWSSLSDSSALGQVTRVTTLLKYKNKIKVIKTENNGEVILVTVNDVLSLKIKSKKN